MESSLLPGRLALTFILCLAPAAGFAAEPIFVKATLANTTLEGGVAFKENNSDPSVPGRITQGREPPAANGGWHWWESEAFQCFSASGEAGNDAPVLRTMLTGLSPETNYQIGGIFRTRPDKETTRPACGDIRMGLNIARTEAFGPVSRKGLSCVIGEDHESKRVTTWRPPEGQAVPVAHAKYPLFHASLGVARSDGRGTLVVFIDDQPNDLLSATTLYEGLLVSLAPDGSEAAVGKGSPQVLVEAVRVNDRETMERELAAGADLNAPDREGLCALFYACLDGDRELVGRFLKQGADPDAAGQRLTPLWAAARNAETQIVRDLLEAGAEVSPTCMRDKQLGVHQDVRSPIRLNPFSAALLSGSTETLELLLERKPGINLGEAVYGGAYDFANPEGASSVSSQMNLIGLSMDQGNFEMVEWLIRRGHGLKLRESDNLPRTRQVHEQLGARSIMIRAVIHDPPLMNIVNALVERGVNPVHPDDALPNSVIAPCDALSAAAFDGNVGLVRLWLPTAKNAGNNYLVRLLALAESCDASGTAALVREAFPNIPRPRYRLTKDEVIEKRLSASGNTDGFVPRVDSRTLSTQGGEAIRMAVIGQGDGAGPADAIVALASAEKTYEVVDREELAAALIERKLGDPQAASPSQLNRIGDLLKADVIVTVGSMGEKTDRILRFEGHDVSTGLTLHREYHLAGKFDPERFTRDFLMRLHSKFKNSRTGNSVTAITLLGISAGSDAVSRLSLVPTLQAGLIQEIDFSPGLVALTRDQLAPLVAEQALGKQGGIWGAAWTIEGGLREGKTPGTITLALRAQSASNGSIMHDVTVDGDVTDPGTLVRKAWAGLREHIHTAAGTVVRDEAGSLNESARLAREAEWLLKSPFPWQAAPLSDAALYLGGDRLERIMLRLKCHWATCHVTNPRLQWSDFGGSSRFATGYPLAPQIHMFYLYWLEEHLELLRLTASTHDEALAILRESPKRPLQDYMQSFLVEIERLTDYRCRLVPQLLERDQKELLATFDAELRRLWESYVENLPPPLTGFHAALPKLLLYAQRSTMNFRQLPWLGDLIAAKLLKAADVSDGQFRHHASYNLSAKTDGDEDFIYPRSGSVADVLRRNLDKAPGCKRVRQREIDYLRAQGPARTRAARSVAHAFGDAIMSRLIPPIAVHSEIDVAQSKASICSDSYNSDFLSIGMPLPSVVAAPRNCVDIRYRLRAYLNARRHLQLVSANDAEWRRAYALLAAFSDRISNLTAVGAKASCFDLLHETLREIDGMFATRMAADLADELRDARPKESIHSFGKSEGFRVAVRDNAIKAEAFAFPAREMGDEHVFMIAHAVDPKDRHLLWLVLQPLTEKDLVLHGENGAKQYERFTLEQPSLLGVDCRTGTVVRRINLIQAAFGGNAPVSSRVWGVGSAIEKHIAFSDEALLVVLCWDIGKERQTRALMLRRDDMAVIQNMRLVDIASGTPEEARGPDFAGCGRDFFLLGRDSGKVSNNSIWRLSPGVAPLRLNLPGRRPPESPFDAEDRNPKILRVDGHKVVVASSWAHYATFDPASGRWDESMAMDTSTFHRYDETLNTRAYHAMLYPHHVLQLNSGSAGRFAPPRHAEPGVLIFGMSGKTVRLPVNLAVEAPDKRIFQISPLPKTPIANFKEHLVRYPPETVTIRDVARSDMVRPAILNQTEEHLILGSYLDIEGAQGIHFNSYEYLPFLWRIPKAEASSYLLRQIDQKQN